MLLHDQELKALKGMIAAKEEPWHSAYQLVMEEAEQALKQEALSIIQAYNSRFFKQDSVYIPGRDGVANPQSNMKAGGLAGKLARCCLVLGTAWEVTGQGKYADKALQLVHGWTIDKATYMVPFGLVAEGVEPGLTPGGEIVMFLAFAPFFLACAVLKNYPGWQTIPRKAVEKWVRSMLEPNRDPMFHNGHVMYNNWEDSRLIYLASGALFLDDRKLLDDIFLRWQQIIPEKMTAEGRLPRETERTRSMHYTLAALSESIQTAEIARYLGKNLYAYSAQDKSFKLALDYAMEFLLDMEKWPYEMLSSEKDGFGGPKFGLRTGTLFELAYSYWHEQKYLAVIGKYQVRQGSGALATLRYGERHRLL